MKKTNRFISTLVLASMLAGTVSMPALAKKIDVNESANGLRGLSGNAVIAELAKDSDSDNKALKLDNETETWTFTTDAGVAQSYDKDIIVSADVYGESGATLTFAVGQASTEVTGTGAWQNVALVIYPKAYEYEVFADGEFVEKKAMTDIGADAAVSSAVFTSTGTFYVDDMNVEQWDKAYNPDLLETVFEESFDGLDEAELNKQNSWKFSQNTTACYGTVQSETAHEGKAAAFASTNNTDSNARYYHDFSAITEDSVASMWLYVPSGSTRKMNITLRAGSNTGDVIAYLFVEKDYLYSAQLGNTFRHAWEYDTWFNLQVVMDWDEKVYNLYVDGKKQNDEPISFGVTTAEQLSCIIFESAIEQTNGEYKSGTWYVDDINVSTIKESGEVWTPVFEDKFENGFSAEAGYSADTIEAKKWYYGSRKSSNPANASFTTVSLDSANVADENSAASGNILYVNADQYTNTDQLPESASTKTVRSEPIVVKVSEEGLTDNVRISADLYALNYFYKSTSETIRRDNIVIGLSQNYGYSNESSSPLGYNSSSSYISVQSGYIDVNKEAGWYNGYVGYNQNAWNHIEITLNDGEIEYTINGSKGTMSDSSNATLGGKFTDLVFYVNHARGGRWYLDNIYVEELETVEDVTNLDNGIRKLLVQNTVDEMYRAANTSDYYVEGLYYTKNNGASYESAPQTQASSEFTLGKAVVVNNTDADLTGALVAAAVYDGTNLTGVAVRNADIKAGESAEVNFTADEIACTVDNVTKLFVWNKETLISVTEHSLNLPAASAWTENDSRTRIFIASASLSAPYTNDYYPQAGWGELIGNYLDQTQVQVIDYGLGGRSSKSFYNESGCWINDGDESSTKNRKSIMNMAREGDWVLLSFAHNDEKTTQDDSGNYIYLTDPYGDVEDEDSYKYWLNKYYEDCKEKGLNLVFISPIPRRLWSNGKLNESTFLSYINTMREFAAEKGIPFVDNYSAMRSKIVDMGEEASADLFMIFDHSDMTENDPFYAAYSNAVKWDKDYTNYDPETDMYTDNTHTSFAGAEVSVEAAVAGLSRIDGFAQYVIK